ncbi:hypothetical protein Taro_046297 [Colocasia esculenta]|uniref:Uncharacterized protein n=1 Tax=Colocasia esculenta TaxID=4460 RepID=A0A843X3Y2_COLES|nr:hypothetical protein [Colocasia esculenta]
MVAPVFRELLCLGGCVPRCCFRSVFDSAGSAGVVASFPVGSKCELQESVAVVTGCACCERSCGLARAAVGFVVGLRVRVGVSQRLREPTCGVAFTGAGLLPVDPVEGVLALLAVPLLWGVSLLDVPLLLGCVLLAVCLALRACAPLGAVLCSVDIFARAKQILVCRVAPLVERCDTWLWLLSACDRQV